MPTVLCNTTDQKTQKEKHYLLIDPPMLSIVASLVSKCVPSWQQLKLPACICPHLHLLCLYPDILHL